MFNPDVVVAGRAYRRFMALLRPAGIAVLAAFALAAPAQATWSTPVRVTAVEPGQTAVAVNARGDAVVAWATPRGAVRTSVHVSLRSRSGKLTSRRVWSSHGLTVSGISVAIDRRGEITLAWSTTTGPRGHGDTIRASYRTPAGRWAAVRVIGHSFDEPLPPERQPRLAVAPDGRVLLAWDARRHPFSDPGRPTVAWRDRGHRFGAAHALKGAPTGLGPIPAFDASGRAYVFGRCNGVVLRTAPGLERFQSPVVLARSALGFDLSVGRPGEGLATWVDGRCTSDPAAGSTLGPVRASVLHRGTFGTPVALTGPGAQAADTTAAAAPAGGGVASWADLSASFTAQVAPDGAVSGTHAVAGGLVPNAFTAAGDLILTGQTSFPTSFVQGGVQVVPAGSSIAEPAPSTFGQLAVAAPTGRAAALLWGTLELSVWGQLTQLGRREVTLWKTHAGVYASAETPELVRPDVMPDLPAGAI